MATAPKTKVMTYKDRPVYRVGNTLYCGNLEDKCILAINILDTKKLKTIDATQSVKIKIMDNTGEFGKGQVFRQAEKTNLYKAFDQGLWWLDEMLRYIEGQ